MQYVQSNRYPKTQPTTETDGTNIQSSLVSGYLYWRSRDDSDLVMDCTSEIHAPSYDPREDRILRPKTDMLQSLLNRPRPNRIWVLQEVVMS